MYVCMYVCLSPYANFCCGCPLQFCIQWYAYRYMGQKWLPLANVQHFPCGALQMITLPNETKAAVQLCPPSMIYTEQLRIRATTAVVRLCAAVSEHNLKGLVEAWQQGANCVQAQRAQGITAKHCVRCRPWLLHCLLKPSFCKLLLRPGVMGIGGNVFMVLEWKLNIVCTVVLGCSHLLLIAATASAHAMLLGSPHNAVYSSSLDQWCILQLALYAVLTYIRMQYAKGYLTLRRWAELVSLHAHCLLARQSSLRFPEKLFDCLHCITSSSYTMYIILVGLSVSPVLGRSFVSFVQSSYLF